MVLPAFIDYEENSGWKDFLSKRHISLLIKAKYLFKMLILFQTCFNDAHCLYGSPCDSRNWLEIKNYYTRYFQNTEKK